MIFLTIWQVKKLILIRSEGLVLSAVFRIVLQSFFDEHTEWHSVH